MNDNPVAPRAEEYDGRIGATVPYYDRLHRETIDLVRTVCGTPGRWLDTGCGTGGLAFRALAVFAGTSFVLADPSRPMLEQAAARLAGERRRVEFAYGSSQELTFADASFDVVTAVLAHHYLDAAVRTRATVNCRRMLKSGGVYVTFENIRPFSGPGTRVGLERWRAFQLREGRTPAEVEAHLARFDREYFPITVAAHLEMLRAAGFAAAELFWASYLQAGFWAQKT